MNEQEINSLRRVLKEIADLAENATLTGGLSSGTQRAVQRYNSILKQLVDAKVIAPGVFEELEPGTDYGQLGVDARLLASYLKRPNADTGDASVLVRLAPFVRSEDLAALVREHVAKGSGIDSHVITALAPFLGQDALGDLVRQHIVGAAPSVAPPPAPERTPQGESMEDLLDQLRRPELSREDRERIAQRIAELSGR